MSRKEIIKNYLKALNIDFKICNLEDITKLTKAHLANLPFSNLKVLLKKDISLNLEDIYKSLVVEKRGGYCFEHNKLMYESLKELGFKVEYFLARAINGENANPAKTHRFTIFTWNEERYLIDVGYGFRSPNLPIKLSKEPTIAQLGIKYNIIKDDFNNYFLKITKDKKEFIATKFDLNRCYEADFELANFYTSKNKNATMTNNLIVSLIKDDEVKSLINSKYIKTTKKEKIVTNVTSAKELSKILQDEFELNFTLQESEKIYTKILPKFK